jgi:hydrogenase expression/formation protein HypC
MCVAVPGRVVSLSEGRSPSRPALVEFGSGDIREVDLAMLPDAGIGDYVITHSGFAIRTVSEMSAAEAYQRLSVGKGR